MDCWLQCLAWLLVFRLNISPGVRPGQDPGLASGWLLLPEEVHSIFFCTSNESAKGFFHNCVVVLSDSFPILG